MDSLVSSVLQGAVQSVLEKDRVNLERTMRTALNSPDKTVEEIVQEFEDAAESQVDANIAKRAKRILEILIEDYEENSLAFLIRYGPMAPYETAFTIESYFRTSRHARKFLTNDKLDLDNSIVGRDYASYISGGLEELLPYCTNIDDEAATRLLSFRGIRVWLEYQIVKGMLQSFSSLRDKVVRDDVNVLNSRLGPGLTNELIEALSDQSNEPPANRAGGHWEYAEFTYYEDEPFAVRNDKDGVAALFFHLNHIKLSLELEHKRDGWQLAEEPSIVTLMNEARFDMDIEPYGRFSRFNNSKLWTIRSTTLKFKRRSE